MKMLIKIAAGVTRTKDDENYKRYKLRVLFRLDRMESLGKFLPCNLAKQKMIHCVQNSI